jgi:CubicO group peptidase (beta-lactamase class C family)
MTSMTSALLSAVAVALSLVPPQGSADLPARLEGLARACVADAELSGLAVRITTEHGALFEHGFGYADAGRAKVENPQHAREADALFEPLVAVALLQLEHDKRLDLKQALVERFPKLPFEGRKVLLGQLVDHTSGIPSYRGALAARETPVGAQDVLAWLEGRSVEAEPGTCAACSESNALLAAMVVEQAAEAPLAQVLGRSVFEPFGLADTKFAPPDDANLAQRGGGARDVLGLPPLRSSLVDIDRFVRQLGKGTGIGEDGLKRLLEPLEARGDDRAWPAGFALERIGRNAALVIEGTNERGSLRVAWYPELDLVVALATSTGTDALAALERRLTRTILDLPEPELVDLPLDAETRAAYLGAYLIGCNRVTIEERGEHLEYVSPGGERHVLRAQGHQRFVSASDAEFELLFTLRDGKAESFLLTRRGFQTVGRRSE